MKLNPPQSYFPTEDEELHRALVTLFNQKLTKRHGRPKVVIETGTYLGEGTTKAVITAVEESRMLESLTKFFTIEISQNNYEIAVKNLRRYPWIKPIHGSSIDTKDALEFIRLDDAIKNPGQYSDIYYDSEDAVNFYSKEAKGQLFGPGEIGKDAVLDFIVPSHLGDKPIFILDSCGGTGLLEFTRILDLMGDNVFYILAFGTGHLKHFRTLEYIKADPKFWKILGEREGVWILACHDIKITTKLIPNFGKLLNKGRG